MLNVRDLHAFYGKSHILHGVSMEVKPGEIVSLLGRNGSGRSTTIKTIMGLVEGHGYSSVLLHAFRGSAKPPARGLLARLRRWRRLLRWPRLHPTAGRPSPALPERPLPASLTLKFRHFRRNSPVLLNMVTPPFSAPAHRGRGMPSSANGGGSSKTPKAGDCGTPGTQAKPVVACSGWPPPGMASAGKGTPPTPL